MSIGVATISGSGHARRFEQAPGMSVLPPIATEMVTRGTYGKCQ